MHTNKSKPFTILIIFKWVFASTVRREENQVIAPALHARAQLSFTLAMQPAHYHYKKQSVKHMGQGKKKTLLR